MAHLVLACLLACAVFSIGVAAVCNAGYFSPQPNAACAACSAGSYQPTGGATACLLCSPGSFQPIQAAVACIACVAGTNSSAVGATASTTCAPCDAGRISSAGQASCSPCAAGTYQDQRGAARCLTCPSGAVQGQTGATGCMACPPGTSQASNVTCAACATGTYQNQNGTTTCVSCMSGTYQNQTNASSCTACLPGTYQSRINATACYACPAGAYQNASAASSCAACAAGLRLAGLTACALCPAGAYQRSPTDSACAQCAPGQTYSPVPGATACRPCTQCGDSEWFARPCTPASDSQCAPCTQCPNGQYAGGQCIRGSSTAGPDGWSQSQDTRCVACPACPDGTYLSSGCADNAPPVCSPCSVCGENTILLCTPLSDTVCGETVHCRNAVPFEAYAWLQPSNYCAQGQYLLGLDPAKGTPSCARCPAGTYGPNGLWCEPCPGYKTPYFDGTQCVCYPGTTQNAGDNCECAGGREFLDAGCAPCAAGSYSNWTLEIGDAWWSQYKACEPCPPGTDSPAGATACEACAYGKYREANASAGCLACEPTGYYAEDPTDGLSCTPCNATCAPGFSPQPCPAYAGGDLFLCEPCPDPPANASSTAVSHATANTACNWQCDTGFYQQNGSACAPCTIGDCPAGFNRSACTPEVDSNCDQACVDKSKPPLNADWISGCTWGCAEGYELSINDYLLWVQYSCVVAGSRSFSFWA